MVCSGPIMLLIRLISYTIGKWKNKRVSFRRLGSAIRALFKEAEAAGFLGIVYKEGERSVKKERNESNRINTKYNTRDDQTKAHKKGRRTCKHIN